MQAPTPRIAAPQSGSAPPTQSPDPAPVGGDVKPAVVVTATKPTYPPTAYSANIQGKVVVMAVVGVDGRVKQATAESGHPMLTDAALKAVRTWIFRPALLNG